MSSRSYFYISPKTLFLVTIVALYGIYINFDNFTFKLHFNWCCLLQFIAVPERVIKKEMDTLITTYFSFTEAKRCEISCNYFFKCESHSHLGEISFKPLCNLEFSRFSQDLHVRNPRLLKSAVQSLDQAFCWSVYLLLRPALKKVEGERGGGYTGVALSFCHSFRNSVFSSFCHSVTTSG